MIVADRPAEKSERSKPEESHLQFQHVVNEKDYAACFRSPNQNGAETMAKAGLPDGGHLLESCQAAEAMSKRSNSSESTPKVTPVAQAIDGKPTGPKLPQTTDYDGKDCELKASNEKEYPLSPLGNEHGCEYGDDPAVKSVYDEAAKHTLKVRSDKGGGSGVIVGKDGDICKVLVDNHQIHGTETDPQVEVEAPNGQVFEATQGLADPKRDLFLLDVDMWSNPSRCNPAKVADSPPKPRDQLTDVGYPRHSAKSPYASVGRYTGDTQQKYLQNDPILDPDRTLGNIDGTSIPGISGSGIFNSDGKLVGVADYVSAVDGHSGSYTPITSADVANLVARSKVCVRRRP